MKMQESLQEILQKIRAFQELPVYFNLRDVRFFFSQKVKKSLEELFRQNKENAILLIGKRIKSGNSSYAFEEVIYLSNTVDNSTETSVSFNMEGLIRLIEDVIKETGENGNTLLLLLHTHPISNISQYKLEPSLADKLLLMKVREKIGSENLVIIGGIIPYLPSVIPKEVQFLFYTTSGEKREISIYL